MAIFLILHQTRSAVHEYSYFITGIIEGFFVGGLKFAAWDGQLIALLQWRSKEEEEVVVVVVVVVVMAVVVVVVVVVW